VAHHVVEHSPALQAAIPEPWHVRPCMLLGRPCEIRPASGGCAACPQQFASCRNLRREHLVLQVSVHQPDTIDQFEHLLRFCNVSRERLFACNTTQGSNAAFDCGNDLLHVLYARLVRTGKPDRVYRRIGNKVGDRLVSLHSSDVKVRCEPCKGVRIPARGAPHANYVCITHTLEALEMEPGVESASDESNAEAGRC